jgi:orotidine-5'-phosphate decarboxylase
MIRAMQARDRLIVAADLTSRDEILHLADELHDVAGVLKIGLQAFVANGPELVREVVNRDIRVFLDLKMHDIPNTVQNAVASAETLGVAMLTVHASGGGAMLRAAVSDEMLILAVTVLTSLDDLELRQAGFADPALTTAVRLARLAKDAGLRGAVASPLEISAIREACGPDFMIVTPGIRPSGAAAGDQRRTMTPEQAMRAGADYLVVGRPITGAANRREAALRVIDEITIR